MQNQHAANQQKYNSAAVNEQNIIQLQLNLLQMSDRHHQSKNMIQLPAVNEQNIIQLQLKLLQMSRMQQIEQLQG